LVLVEFPGRRRGNAKGQGCKELGFRHVWWPTEQEKGASGPSNQCRGVPQIRQRQGRMMRIRIPSLAAILGTHLTHRVEALYLLLTV